ncbi:hypothetical protein AAEX28_09780 [Lentisphaerota bacterium WC36G]|nr:hypothetical protein LJT99_12615 [Lentisphaerae bacterium WC36]
MSYLCRCSWLISKKSFLGVVLVFLALFAMVGETSAEVAMKLELERKVYMQYERVVGVLTLRNQSARPLIFGHNSKFKGSIEFQVFRDGKMVFSAADRRFDLEGIMLSAGETRTLKFDISGKFKLRDTGRYEMQAFLSHSLLMYQYKSNQVNFRVDTGVKLWDITVGVPDFLTRQKVAKELGDKIKPSQVISGAKVGQTVTYSIRSLFERGEKVFYFMAEDQKNIYAVRRIGSEMSQKHPKVEVDIISNLHVLLRATPRIFVYFNFDTRGRIIEHRVLKPAGSSSPSLQRSQKGFVQVVGGVDAQEKKDYKKAIEEPFNDVIKK